MTKSTAAPGVPIWQEEPPVVPATLDWLKLSGMGRLQAGLRGEFAPPSFGRLTGMTGAAYGPGEARIEMPVTNWLLNPAGLLTAGIMPYLADWPLGSAVFTQLAPGEVITTSEMSMNYLRPVSPEVKTLLATGQLVHMGRSYAFSEVRISTDDGKLVAHGTARNLLIKIPVPEGPFVAPPRQVVAADYVDPYLRPPMGSVLPAEIWTRLSGLEIQQRVMAGDLPASPVAELFGIRRSEVSEGRAVITAPATKWLESPARRLYGGATALLADAAMTIAVQTTTPAGTASAPLDIKVQFLRPIKSDGQQLTVGARVVHRGRTLAVTNAEVIGADGKVAALATSTWLIVPDFSWATDRWVPTDEVEVTEDDSDSEPAYGNSEPA